MPYQIFKIVRPPESKPITPIEIKRLLSAYRQAVEWEVREVEDEQKNSLTEN